MLRLVLIIAMLLSSCQTRKAKSDFIDVTDYGLDEQPDGSRVDDRAYFDELKRSESAVGNESSLPLPLMVGKTGDPFDAPPPGSKQGADSRLIFNMGPCHFALLTGPLQVDRYLLANQWIKLSEGLPAKTPLKLEPNMDLNLKVVSKLALQIPDKQVPVCRKLLEGRKVVLGRFHLNKSRIGFIPGGGSPKVAFGARSLEPKGKQVFVRWVPGSRLPIIIDDFDFPATAESGIFRAQMSNRGFYYLAFQPVLRMDQSDGMVINLPLPGSRKQPAKSGAKPQKP